MVKYSLAGQWANAVHALAIGESNEKTSAIGDGGQAIGILQQHPAFMWEWVTNSDITLTRTWDDLQILAAGRFFQYYVGRHYNRNIASVLLSLVSWKENPALVYSIEDVVQMYNLGVGAFNSGKRNILYLQRWQNNMKRIGAK